MGVEGGKRLSELRVCDLKLELEKRSLEITGVKMDLVKRLQEVSVSNLQLQLFMNALFKSALVHRCDDNCFYAALIFIVRILFGRISHFVK